VAVTTRPIRREPKHQEATEHDQRVGHDPPKTAWEAKTSRESGGTDGQRDESHSNHRLDGHCGIGICQWGGSLWGEN